MKKYKIAGTIISAGAACLFFASQASAAVSPPGGGSWDHIWTTTDSSNGGTVYVKEYGDYITVCDTAADGKSPHVAISYESGGANVWYYLVASGGYNTCATRDASYGGVYNLPENTDINVKIGLGSASAPENDWTSTYSTYFLNDN